MNIQTEDNYVWKAKCVGARAFCRTGSDRLRKTGTRTTPRPPAGLADVAGNMPALPSSIRAPNKRAVPAQELRGGHSPFSFKLHFGERKCGFAGGNDQFFVAAQNFSGFAIEVDN